MSNARNTRVDAGICLLRTPVVPAHRSSLRVFQIKNGTARVAFANIFTTARHAGTEEEQIT
jgi:hypothetical protein